jgi:DNA-binding Xre family transcriptional regulator
MLGDKEMTVSYKKLWHLLIERDMLKKDLREASGISPASMAKLSKGENVNTDTLAKICSAMNCDVSEIMEMLPNNDSSTQQGEK